MLRDKLSRGWYLLVWVLRVYRRVCHLCFLAQFVMNEAPTKRVVGCLSRGYCTNIGSLVRSSRVILVND